MYYLAERVEDLPELNRLYMAYKNKAEELCRKYSVEAQLVIFTA